jgi:AICAR transformylase/IMP cyclohydrolase PurH
MNEFSQDSLEQIENEQYTLNKIIDKLDIGVITINLANEENIKNVIANIYNSDLKIKQILSNVEKKLSSATQIQINGYFETEKYLKDKKQLYGQIADDAIKIAKTLDNNELIDTTFDNIMINFRDQFTSLLNYIEKSKKLKFPIKENIFADSILSPSSKNDIDDILRREKLNILNFTREENKKYLKDEKKK